MLGRAQLERRRGTLAEATGRSAGRGARRGPCRRDILAPVNVIVLPTYNERENLRHALAPHPRGRGRPRRAAAHADRRRQLAGRHRATWPTSSRARCPTSAVLHRAGKEGLGKAYFAGFREALAMGAERIFEMDADLSHDASYLPHFLRLIDQGADLVLGSRYVKGGGVENWSLSRKVISRGGCLYAQTILGLPLARPHRRLQVLPPRGARGHRPRRRRRQGLRLPDRDDLPRAQAGLQGRGAAHHLRRPQGGREQDEQRHLRSRPW